MSFNEPATTAVYLLFPTHIEARVVVVRSGHAAFQQFLWAAQMIEEHSGGDSNTLTRLCLLLCSFAELLDIQEVEIDLGRPPARLPQGLNSTIRRYFGRRRSFSINFGPRGSAGPSSMYLGAYNGEIHGEFQRYQYGNRRAR